MRIPPISIPVLLALTLPFAGCTTSQRTEVQTAAARLLISDQDLNQLGERMHQELEQQGVKYSQDPVVTSYVEGIAQDIFQVAKKDRPNVNFHVHVIDDSQQVNAFATPGGHLYVFSGLLGAADTKAEVAGVMGHEVGHVTADHIARQMVTQVGLEQVASLALGKDPSRLAQITTTLLGKGALLAFSRQDELEADAYAVTYSSQAGYDPRGIATFFQKLKAREGEMPRFVTWLSTHPATQDRIQNVEKLVAERGLKGGKEGREEQQAIKQRLSQSSGQSSGASQTERQPTR